MKRLVLTNSKSKANIVVEFDTLSVADVLNIDSSDKGNRTFIYAKDQEEIFTDDGQYTIQIQVTAWVKPGTIKGSEEYEKSSLNDIEKKKVAQVASSLKVLTPEMLMEALKAAGKI